MSSKPCMNVPLPILHKDLIEKDDKNIHRLTDPVMETWLRE